MSPDERDIREIAHGSINPFAVLGVPHATTAGGSEEYGNELISHPS